MVFDISSFALLFYQNKYNTYEITSGGSFLVYINGMIVDLKIAVGIFVVQFSMFYQSAFYLVT